VKEQARSAEKTGFFGCVGGKSTSFFTEGAETSDRQFVRGRQLEGVADGQGVGLMNTLKGGLVSESEDPEAGTKPMSG
jgi:hypothetical protein